MADTPPTAPAQTGPMTSQSALVNAARLLHAAELETNLALMERLEHLADTWVAIANMLAIGERA